MNTDTDILFSLAVDHIQYVHNKIVKIEKKIKQGTSNCCIEKGDV